MLLHLLQPRDDGGDGFFQRAGAGGDADDFGIFKPLFTELIGARDVDGAAACDLCGGDELERVVAVAAAHDDERVAIFEQLSQCSLPVFRGLADGVAEEHFARRKMRTQRGDDFIYTLDGLCGLRDDSVVGRGGEFGKIGLAFDDDGFREIADEALHLDVARLADDDGMATERDECAELIVCVPDEWARSVRDAESCFTPIRSRFVARAVGGDHDLRSRRIARCIELTLAHAERREPFADDWIVDEFAQNGERPVRRELFRLRNGVTNAEAKAVMFC